MVCGVGNDTLSLLPYKGDRRALEPVMRGHFVLIVDGLDEDRGLDGSADAHSIAALLPHSGIRMIVAERPAPELPEDVPVDHPLRTCAHVEELSPSTEANAGTSRTANRRSGRGNARSSTGSSPPSSAPPARPKGCPE